MALSGFLFVAAAVCVAVLCSAQVVPGPRKIAPSFLPVQEVPASFAFGYDVSDGLGMTQKRHEISSNGIVEGTYGFSGPNGIYRQVFYTANGDGFKARLHSNEPGMANNNPADAEYIVAPPPPAALLAGARLILPLQNTL